MEMENKNEIVADTSIIKANTPAIERPDFSWAGSLAMDLFPGYRQYILIATYIHHVYGFATHPWTLQKINNTFTGGVNGVKYGADATYRGLKATAGYASQGTSAAINKVTSTSSYVKDRTLSVTAYLTGSTRHAGEASKSE